MSEVDSLAQLEQLSKSCDLWDNPKFVLDNVAGWIQSYFPVDTFAICELIDEIKDIVEWYQERGELKIDPLQTDEDITLRFDD